MGLHMDGQESRSFSLYQVPPLPLHYLHQQFVSRQPQLVLLHVERGRRGAWLLMESQKLMEKFSHRDLLMQKITLILNLSLEQKTQLPQREMGGSCCTGSPPPPPPPPPSTQVLAPLLVLTAHQVGTQLKNVDKIARI